MHVDANAKVSGEDDGNVLRGIANRLLSGIVKTGGADHHPFAVLTAETPDGRACLPGG